MDRRLVGWVLTAAGVVIALVAAIADQIGLGDADGVGWKQVVGIVVGVLVAALGVVTVRRTGPREEAPTST